MGNDTQFPYEGEQLKSLTNPHGKKITFVSYNEENNTVTFTDELENQTVYIYDASHNITAIALGDSCIHNSYNAETCNTLI